MGLGWAAHREDRRLLEYTATPLRLRAEHLPRALDLRSYFPPLGQGRLNSGCGHALAVCLEILHWIRTRGERVHLSPMFAYLAAQKACGLLGDDAGATLCGAIKAAKAFGVCPQSAFRETCRYRTEIPAPAYARAAPYRVVSHTVLKSYDELHAWLALGLGPVLLGVPWTESLQTCRGRIDAISGATFGGQVLVAAGYVAATDRAQTPDLLLRNSHGAQWGDNGYALAAPEVIDGWARSSDALCIGVSDLARYRVRRLDWMNE